MDILINQRKGLTEFVLKGKFNLESAEELENLILKKIDEIQSSQVACSFEEITFLDSSGLGSLIKILNYLKERRRELIIVGVTPKIRNIFQLSRLEKFFVFIDNAVFQKEYPLLEK